MFIVVAIVIFGIFVSLSYTLFGKTLQPQVVSLFENATNQAAQDLKNEKYGPNLIDSNSLFSYEPYHTNPIAKGNSIEMIATSNMDYIAIRTPKKIAETGKTYKISGYLSVNGKVGTEDIWDGKRVSTYSNVKTNYSKFDNNTGYFEFISTWEVLNDNIGSSFIIHTKLKIEGQKPEAGDKIAIKDLKMQEVI